MAKKSYAKHVWMYLGLCAVLSLFLYVLIEHHRGIPDRVREQRGPLLSADADASLTRQIKPVGHVAIAAAPTPNQQAPTAAPAASPAASRDAGQVYQAGCVTCHGTGVAGAPKVGDKGQWAKRVAKGRDALYASAIKGTQGAAGVMPPKGGNPSLSDAEVKAAVDYMVGQSK